MARPMKSGLPYWPRDVGFLRDKKVKMLKADFGIKGIFILECLLDAIYEDEGYFKKWDDDDCHLMSAGIGDGCSPQLIAEVVKGCVRRSFFDKRVFDLFGVLTSAGIQRRYILGAGKRDRIRLIEEYWLLPKEEISASVLLKCAFFRISGEETAVSVEKTRVSVSEMTQRKEKERKANKSKVEESKAPSVDGLAPSARVSDFLLVLDGFYSCTGVSATERERQALNAYVDAIGKDLVLEGFRIAQARGVCTWPYIKGILEPWRIAGYRQLDQLELRRQTSAAAVPSGRVDSERVQSEFARIDKLLEGLASSMEKEP